MEPLALRPPFLLVPREVAVAAPRLRKGRVVPPLRPRAVVDGEAPGGRVGTAQKPTVLSQKL